MQTFTANLRLLFTLSMSFLSNPVRPLSRNVACTFLIALWMLNLYCFKLWDSWPLISDKSKGHRWTSSANSFNKHASSDDNWSLMTPWVNSTIASSFSISSTSMVSLVGIYWTRSFILVVSTILQLLNALTIGSASSTCHTSSMITRKLLWLQSFISCLISCSAWLMSHCKR